MNIRNSIYRNRFIWKYKYNNTYIYSKCCTSNKHSTNKTNINMSNNSYYMRCYEFNIFINRCGMKCNNI